MPIRPISENYTYRKFAGFARTLWQICPEVLACLLQVGAGALAAWGKAFKALLDARGVGSGSGARNGRSSATVAEVAVKEMSPMGDVPPPTIERHARDLARIENPQERAEVWEEVVGYYAPGRRSMVSFDVEAASKMETRARKIPLRTG